MTQKEHRQIKLWQYELQLTFQTTNLHIIGAWRLTDDNAVEVHRKQAKRLGGPVFHSWFPTDALTGRTTVVQMLSGQMPPIDWRNFLFPVGSMDIPKKLNSNHFICCSLAVGISGTADLTSGTWRVPEHMSSLVSIENRTKDDCRMTYVVRQSDQVIPIAVVEFTIGFPT